MQTPTDASMEIPRRDLSNSTIVVVCAPLAFEKLGSETRPRRCCYLVCYWCTVMATPLHDIHYTQLQPCPFNSPSAYSSGESQESHPMSTSPHRHGSSHPWTCLYWPTQTHTSHTAPYTTKKHYRQSPIRQAFHGWSFFMCLASSLAC